MTFTDKIEWLKNFAVSELTSNILPFWRTKAVDEQNGGFYGEITHTMQVVKNSPKGLILNARILWTFSAAYQYTNNPVDKSMAKRAYDYLCTHFYDSEYGGYYWSVSADGKPLDTKKQIYGLAFTMYGFSEYYKITKDENVLQRAIDIFSLIEDHAFDKELNGYIEAYARDWKEIEDIRLSVKDMNEKKTMNTHLHILEAYANLFTVWKDARLAEKLENLLLIFLNRIVSPDGYHLKLFFDEKWNNKSTIVSFGHDIEASWLIHESAKILGKKELILETEKIAPLITNAALEGLSKIGGIYHEGDSSNAHIEKEIEWWPQAEALVGLMNTYQVTGEEKYIDAACSIGLFAQKFLIDTTNGEWFYRVDKTGKPIETYVKAGFWKCPYHNSRACLELIKRIAGHKEQ
jgi:cellobiose epimerase